MNLVARSSPGDAGFGFFRFPLNASAFRHRLHTEEVPSCPTGCYVVKRDTRCPRLQTFELVVLIETCLRLKIQR